MRAASCSMFSPIFELILRTDCEWIVKEVGEKFCSSKGGSEAMPRPESLLMGKVVEVKVDDNGWVCKKARQIWWAFLAMVSDSRL